MADSNNEPPVFRAKKVEDGGPAFGYGKHEQGGHSGMSLRDYFAGQALAGYVTRPESNDYSYEAIAEWSYRAADAMLADRLPDAELRARFASPSTQPE